jgi:lactate dehydrogenase-like 2-hydroxyacid dehydrogenase
VVIGKPGLLLFTSNTDRMCEPIAERFDVLRLWKETEPDAAIRERGGNVVAILTTGQDRIDAALMDRLPKLRLIVAVGAGYEGVEVSAAKRRAITVANAGDTHSGDVADHAVALSLAVIQRIVPNDTWVRSGTWETKGYPPIRRALSAERFGILGLGRIGRAIANRLVPFGGEIGWWGPTDRPASWPRHESALALATWCTTLIVAVRGDAVALVDRGVIDAVGHDGCIINIARGQVIDEDALIAALRGGRLGGAGLDVFRAEPTPPGRWADTPNVVLSPHVGGVTTEAMARLRDTAVRNLRTALEGGAVVSEILS